MKVYLFLLFAVGLSACTSARLGSLTLASTKNLGYTYGPLQHVTGEDCAYNVLGVPLGSVNPNLQEAIDNAASQVPGADMLTNVTLHRDYLLTLAYNQVCVRVEGDAVSSARPVVAAGAASPRRVPRANRVRTTGNANLDAVQREFDRDDD